MVTRISEYIFERAMSRRMMIIVRFYLELLINFPKLETVNIENNSNRNKIKQNKINSDVQKHCKNRGT